MDFEVEDDKAWYDAISDDIDPSILFDEFGNYKGRIPDLEVQCSDSTWYDAITPNQHVRNEVEESTYICTEHAYCVHHFDNEDFKAVLLANDTEFCEDDEDSPNLIEDDDDQTVAQVVPPDRILNNDAPNIIKDDDGDAVPTDKDANDDIKDAPARAFKVDKPDYEQLCPLFGWQDGKMPRLSRRLSRTLHSMPGCLMVQFSRSTTGLRFQLSFKLQVYRRV